MILNPVDDETSYGVLTQFKKRLIEIKEQYGSESIAGIVSPEVSLEAAYLFQKWYRTILESNNIYALNWIDEPDSIPDVLHYALACPNPSPPLEFLLDSDVVLVLNNGEFAPDAPIQEMLRASKSQNQTSIFSFGEGGLFLNDFADEQINVRDACISEIFKSILSLAHLQGATDRQFIWFDQDRYQKNIRLLRNITPQSIADCWNLDANLLMKIAKAILQKKSVSLLIGSPPRTINSYSRSVKDALNMMLSLGHIGSRGRGIFYFPAEMDSTGPGLMGASHKYWPGFLNRSSNSALRWYSSCWNHSMPQIKNESMETILEKLATGKIKALVFLGDPQKNSTIYATAQYNLKHVKFIAAATTHFLSNCGFWFPIRPFKTRTGMFLSLDRKLIQRDARPEEEKFMGFEDWEIVSNWIRSFNSITGEPPMARNDILNEIFDIVPSFYNSSVDLGSGEIAYWKPFSEILVSPGNADFDLSEIDHVRFFEVDGINRVD